MKIGDVIKVKGPIGKLTYHGKGLIKITHPKRPNRAGYV
jgi:hypothetical protein